MAYNGLAVSVGSRVSRLASVVAYYGDKPEVLSNLVLNLQDCIVRKLGAAFAAYELSQVHATLIGIECVLEGNRFFNKNFLEHRGRERSPDLTGVIRLLQSTSMLPLDIQIGGFRPEVDYRFDSRGLHPSQRSFSFDADSAVLIGWPVSSSGHPSSLNLLRAVFQNFNVLHKYHAASTDIDNDLFFVVGRLFPGLSAREKSETEMEIRGLLSGRSSFVPLRRDDIAIVRYTDSSLPSVNTQAIPITNDADDTTRMILEL